MGLPGQQAYTAISERNEGTLMPCSSEAKPSAPTATESPASPNNDLIYNKINAQFSSPSMETWEHERE